jgi:hypothetical protein
MQVHSIRECASESLVVAGRSGKYLLKPTIKVLDVTVTKDTATMHDVAF